MKVILLQDIKGKGKKGQCIEASDGYARNYLLPRKLAVEANADNLNTMRMNDKAAAEKAAKERAEALEISRKLKELTVTVAAKGGGAGRLFGSVTGEAIAEAIKQQLGYEVDKRKIELSEQIKQAGRFEMTLRLGPNITARMFAIVEAV